MAGRKTAGRNSTRERGLKAKFAAARRKKEEARNLKIGLKRDMRGRFLLKLTPEKLWGERYRIIEFFITRQKTDDPAVFEQLKSRAKKT